MTLKIFLISILFLSIWAGVFVAYKNNPKLPNGYGSRGVHRVDIRRDSVRDFNGNSYKDMNHLVCSHETAEKMRTLGFPQMSLFWHVMWHPYSMVLPGPSWEVKYTGELVDWKDDEYIAVSAYLAGELGEMLKTSPYPLPCRNDDEKWFFPINGWDKFSGVTWENEAEARAIMLIHLAEQGVIDPKKL